MGSKNLAMRWVWLLAAGAMGCGVSEAQLESADEDATSFIADELRTNSDPNRVVVYSNNLENMIFDWKDLVHVMAESELRPDIFLVQQVTNRSELERLMGFMKQRMGVKYEGLVAQNRPNDHRFDGQLTPRPTVTTGVVFRSSRFELRGHDSWMPFGTGFKNQNQSCDQRSNHSGYETLRVKLHDKVAKKDIVVVSLRHWTWEPCSTKNVMEIVNGNEGGPNAHPGLGAGVDLHVVGGDFNDRVHDGDGAYKCWYRQMNRSVPEGSCPNDTNLGFTDPLYGACDGERSCVRTRGDVDSLFVRRADGVAARTDHFDVVSFDQAERASRAATGGDGPSNVKSRDGYNDVADRYSGHEARRSYVYYR
jgi:hypothetical protein